MSTSRPTHCLMCETPITQPATGRPRRTCSDVCRQRLRSSKQLIDPEMRKRMREGERLMRLWEKRWGPFDRRPMPGAMTDLKGGLCKPLCGFVMVHNPKERYRARAAKKAQKSGELNSFVIDLGVKRYNTLFCHGKKSSVL